MVGETESAIPDRGVCPICGALWPSFTGRTTRQSGPYGRLCPGCGSLERQRVLAQLLEGALGRACPLAGADVFAVAPSRSERKILTNREIRSLTVADVRPEARPDVVADVSAMPHVATSSFDVVLASFVLTTVYDLRGALAEFARILRDGGVLLTTDPERIGARTETNTDLSVITAWYGQDAYEKYKVGAFRRFGELDAVDLLSEHFRPQTFVGIDGATGERIVWRASTKDDRPAEGPVRRESASIARASGDSVVRIAGDAWQPGVGETVFDELGEDEWISFDGVTFASGDLASVFANLSHSSRKTLRIEDGAGETAGALVVNGQKIAAPVTQEHGVTGEPTTTVAIPVATRPGIYFIDGKFAIVVSRAAKKGDVTVVLPTTTMAFFNKRGSRKQTGAARPRGTLVSLRRPLEKRTALTYGRCDGFVAWAARQSDLPLNFVGDDSLEALDLRQSKVVVLVGRSEYWTRANRRRLDDYIASGGNAVFMTAETQYREVQAVDGGSAFVHWRRGTSTDWLSPQTGRWCEPERDYPVLPSIGPNPFDGGYVAMEDRTGQHDLEYKVVSESPLFRGTGLRLGDAITLPAIACDGLPISRYESDTPVIDASAIPFWKWELLAWGRLDTVAGTKIAPLFAFQKTRRSGCCIHFGSFVWALRQGLGEGATESAAVTRIVENAIELLRTGTDIFTDAARKA